MTTAAAAIVLLVIAVVSATIWHLVVSKPRGYAERDAALRIETEKAVQEQRAKGDAPGVAPAAAQERPKRKRKRKK